MFKNNVPFHGQLGIVGEITFFTSEVTLAGKDVFERFKDERLLLEEHAAFSRTKIYENLHIENLDQHRSYPQLASTQLIRLARRKLFCSLFVSTDNDLGVGKHCDKWNSAIVQINGEKEWFIYDSNDNCVKFLMQAGDILLLPTSIFHEVTTPKYSEHLLFGFLDEKIH